MMHYLVYRITNMLNGKVYIGKHQTDDVDDGYMGSGVAIKNALRVHGRENFRKEILHDFDDESTMNAKEAELVDEAFYSRYDTYNEGPGGEGGAHFKGRHHTEETKSKVSASLKGRQISIETRQKLSRSHTGKRLSEETKRKISKSIRLMIAG